MILSSKEIACIICGSQEDCIRPLGEAGQCGDCLIPANLIYTMINDLPPDPDYLYENWEAKRILKEHENT